MEKQFRFWVGAISAGFSALILIKTMFLAPEEIVRNPALSAILFYNIVLCIQDCKNAQQKTKTIHSRSMLFFHEDGNSGNVVPAQTSAALPSEVDCE